MHGLRHIGTNTVKQSDINRGGIRQANGNMNPMVKSSGPSQCKKLRLNPPILTCTQSKFLLHDSISPLGYGSNHLQLTVDNLLAPAELILRQWYAVNVYAQSVLSKIAATSQNPSEHESNF